MICDNILVYGKNRVSGKPEYHLEYLQHTSVFVFILWKYISFVNSLDWYIIKIKKILLYLKYKSISVLHKYIF